MNEKQTNAICDAMVFLATMQDLSAYMSNDDIQNRINKYVKILEEANISE